MNQKILFTPAGLWNLSIGFTGLLFQEFAINLFFGDGAYTGEFIAVIMTRIVMLAVIIFGLGYLMVARDPEGNRGVIILGLLSKLILFIMYTYYFMINLATIWAFLAVLGDFFWGILFIWYLCKGNTDSMA